MIIEVALGILLAIFILATAVLWIPLVVGVVVIAAIAGIGYAIYLQPFMFAFPALCVGVFVLAAWLFREANRYIERKRT